MKICLPKLKIKSAPDEKNPGHASGVNRILKFNPLVFIVGFKETAAGDHECHFHNNKTLD